MTPSFSISKRIISVCILVTVAIQFHFIRYVSSLNQTNAYLHHQCLNSQGTYKSGSPYERSVIKAINMTYEHMLIYGYVDTATGEPPNNSFSKLQCRGDLSLSQCRSCITTAFSEVQKRCPNKKGKIIWYDYCVLEITSVVRTELDYNNYMYLSNTMDVSGNKESFNEKTKALLYKLMEKAHIEKDRKRKNYSYATGEESIGMKKLYAMVQCTKDLSRKNCSVCLNEILAKFPECCNGKQGGRVLCTNCNFRYEIYPFVKSLV